MSYISVPAGYARDIAQSYLDAREHRIRRDREALVERFMWRRWFRPRTREKALEMAKDTLEWRDIGIRGGMWAGEAEELLALAKCSRSQTVQISDRHSWLIDRYNRKGVGHVA